MKTSNFVCLTLATTLLALSARALPAGAQEAGSDETRRLIATLTDDTPVYEKAMACRRLAAIGDDRAVPALARLLDDDRLAAYARSGLEGIPTPAAAAALRDAVSRLDGDALIGVIDSLGKRRDRDAVDLLAARLSAENPGVAAAAIRALGKIGDARAAEKLLPAFDGPEAQRNNVALACVACGVRLASREPAMALKLFEAVREANVPSHITLSATQQWIVAQGADGLDRLTELFQQGEDAAFPFALQAARQLGKPAAPCIVQQLGQASLQRRIPLLQVLADVGGDSSVFLTYARDESPRVRAECMKALGRYDSAAAVEMLISGLQDSEADVVNASLNSLATTNSTAVDEALGALLAKSAGGDPDLAIIQLAGRRRMVAATPQLMAWARAGGRSQEVALAALGSTVSLEQLPDLLKFVIEPSSEALQQAAMNAVANACSRLPREASAQVLIGAIKDAPTAGKVKLLEQLARLGGEKALAAVAEAAQSDVDALQDAATRLLGTWPTSDAADPLLALSRSLKNNKYRIRALRGYIRVARQLQMSTAERIDVCRNALELAERADEQNLVLEALRRYPSPEGLRMAVPLLNQSGARGAARNAVVTIAQNLVSTDPDLVMESLAAVETSTPNPKQVETIKALLAAARAVAEQMRSEEGFVSIFDGKSFDGWHGNLDVFRIEDEQIVAGNLKDRVPRNEFLRTDRQYDDFELRLQFKLLGARPNAGVQIRTQEIPDHHEVSGYQADMGPGWWGCLYDESRRRKVLAGPPQDERGKPVRENDWNDYRIRCEGPRIRLWINDELTVDYTEQDSDIPLSGIIAVQIHAGEPMEARYRNLRVRTLK